MKTLTSLALLASFLLAFMGCSGRSHLPAGLKNNDLGVIHVSSSQPSSRTLADGRACNITATALPDGNVSLTTTIDEANGATKTLVFEAPADGRAYTFSFDPRTTITVRLRK